MTTDRHAAGAAQMSDVNVAHAAASLDMMPDPAVLVEVREPDLGPEGCRVMAANRAAAALTGTDVAAVVDLPLEEALRFPGAESLVRACLDVAATGAPVSRDDVAMPAPSAQGDTIAIDVRAWPVGGAVAVSWRHSLDTTHSARAAEAVSAAEAAEASMAESRQDLQEARDRLRLVLESSRLGLWDWNMQTGETVFNERWAEIVGYTLDELQPISIDTWVRLANPDDLGASDSLIAAHAAGETEFYEIACRMRHKNGHWVWVRDRGRIVEWDQAGNPLRMTGTHEDITALQQANLAHATSEAALKLLMESMVEGLVVQDTAGVIVSCNPAAERILGMTFDQMTGRTSADPHWRSVHEDGSDFPGEDHPAMVTLRTGEPVRDVLMGVHKGDGSLSWIVINSRAIPALEDPSAIGGALTTFVDITDAYEARKDLQDLASRDPLTELLNRRGMRAQIESMLSAAGNGGYGLGVLFIDLDGLKEHNDTLGHLVGDDIIVTVARRIQRSVRKDDVVARFGGDEFLVLLPHSTDRQGAARVAAAIHEAVRQPMRISGGDVSVTCSIGVAIMQEGEDAEEAITRADMAAYEAKRKGRDQTAFSEPH